LQIKKLEKTVESEVMSLYQQVLWCAFSYLDVL